MIRCGILYRMPVAQPLSHLFVNILAQILDALTFLKLCFRSRVSLAAENLFLRKQLAVYLERQVKPRRATDANRLSLVFLSRLFEWRSALTIVKPEILIGWHRKSFRRFWRWKSKPRGRPRLPLDLRNLIEEIAVSNPTWGEERIADELLIKLGIRVSPRTVRRYIPESTGPRSGVRRECLDFLIPLNERHLRGVLKEWVAHYNRGRPHSNLGPGIPDPGTGCQGVKPCGHHIPIDHHVVAKAILGGLHHEYRFERHAA